MKPTIIINLKTYKQGRQVLKLAKAIEKVDKQIIVGVQASDIAELTSKTKLQIYAQHTDFQKPGRQTGLILPEAIKADKAKGTFLNHSEHKLSPAVLKKTIQRCKKLKLKTIVFASSLSEAKKIKKLKPDYLVFEPPELVAGKISVSKAKPELIAKIAKKLKTKFIVGAGIHSHEDLTTALKLGASGIALSSAITKAKNPEKKLRKLLKN
tara:strand:- start:11665 stop:12294 length:630 start_codon:yes stop_codon:yes gene_type:complete